MKLRHQPAHQGQLVLETPNMTRLFPCMVSCTITVLLKDNLIINSEWAENGTRNLETGFFHVFLFQGHPGSALESFQPQPNGFSNYPPGPGNPFQLQPGMHPQLGWQWQDSIPPTIQPFSLPWKELSQSPFLLPFRRNNRSFKGIFLVVKGIVSDLGDFGNSSSHPSYKMCTWSVGVKCNRPCAHSHSILIGGRLLSFWLDRGLAASPKTKNSVWDPSPTQGRGEHSYMFSTPYNRAF